MAIGGFIASRGFATHGLRVNDKKFAMRAFGPTATMDILGSNGKLRPGQVSYVLPEDSAPGTGTAPLATIKVNLQGKIQVSKGAYEVRPNRGFKALPNGGAEMTAPSGAFELHDSSNQLVTIVNVKRG